MASTMAIVSKAVFEKEARGLGLGDTWTTARYASQNKGLAQLAGGGDLYLVTVRPPDEALWLVAILRAPRQTKGEWRASENTVPIADLGALQSTLKFATGVGLPTKSGALGMSLQTPRVLTDDDVAQLEGAATKRKASKPRAVKPASTSISSEPIPGGLDALDSALDHLKAGRATAALDDVLAAWRRLRAPQLGELLALVGKQVDRGLDPVVPNDWLDVAKRVDPADVGRLMASLDDTSVVRMKARFEMLLAFAPDPRLVAKALAIPPPFSYEAGPPMTRAFELAERAADVASRKLVERAIAALAPKKGDSAGRKEYLAKHRRRGEKVLAKLPTKIDVPAAVKAQITACVAATKQLLAREVMPETRIAKAGRAQPRKGNTDELLASIFANPDDDGPRTVYADALQQQDDPRGEFIALQLAGKPATAQRERELLKRYVHDWLAPIGPLIRRDSVTFARGFLDACVVEVKTHNQTALFDHPLWSTVRELDCEHESLVTRAHLRALRRATVRPKGLSVLAERATPVPLEDVIGPLRTKYGHRARTAIPLETRDAWKAALEVGALVNLRTLQLAPWQDATLLGTPRALAWLLDSKLGRQLEVLELYGGRTEIPIAPWIDYVANHPAQGIRVRFLNENTSNRLKQHVATFELVARGKIVDVTLSLSHDMVDLQRYAIGGQIERAIAKVPKRLAPSITVKYTGSKKRTELGFPGIAAHLRAAFANVELT